MPVLPESWARTGTERAMMAAMAKTLMGFLTYSRWNGNLTA
jgi:hypothetical protein